MRTYKIELRCDFIDEEKYDVVLEAAREAARTLVTVAMLLKDNRDPRISLEAGDMFEKDADLNIMSE